MEGLYEGARSSKLAATILLMNLCTVHGVTNQCANELFSLLHSHLLPENNTLPQTHHAAKSLTSKLGLTYTRIHACICAGAYFSVAPTRTSSAALSVAVAGTETRLVVASP